MFARNGVATSHPLAVQAGLCVLDDAINAINATNSTLAAVAVMAVMAVMANAEPRRNGSAGGF